jgi:hypothetical protein
MGKNEFFWGIVVGIILTFIGAVIQFQLFVKYDKQKSNREMEVLVCLTMNSRSIRASNVINSSSSSVFNDRWDEYVTQGFYKWNENRGLIEQFLKNVHPTLFEEFKSLNSKFGELHKTIIELRQLQNSESDSRKAKREEVEKLSSEKYREIAQIIVKFENELLQYK